MGRSGPREFLRAKTEEILLFAKKYESLASYDNSDIEWIQHESL